MSFPRYPEYKDSGVEWLGEVPTHWRPTRVKRILAKMGSGGTPATDSAEFWSEQDGHAWAAIGDMSDRDMVNETCKRLTPAGVESKGLTIWPAGTLLFSMYASLGHVAVLGIPAATNQAILALLPNSECNRGYLKRWFEFLRPHLAQEASSNTQDNLNAEKVRNLPALALPMQEQVQIAAFLDHETAKIDALVAEQEKLIALLKEKRQAVISHAVAKGLNPDAPMKDSGIEWLGEVPAHWSRPLKLVAIAAPTQHSFANGPFGSDLLANELTQEGVPVIYIRDLKPSGYRRVSEVCVTSEKARQIAFCNVVAADILVAKVGDPPGLAVVYPANEPPGVVTQDVIRLRVDTEFVWSEFVAFILNSDFGRVSIDQISVESTRTRVGLGDYKQIRVVLPPLSEQSAIAAYLTRQSEAFNELISEAEEGISLLKERRSALISAAVTGKIDVRGFSAAREAA